MTAAGRRGLLVPDHRDLRVAVVYDDTIRRDTTGGYCLRALQQMCRATHIHPRQVQADLSRFDMLLRVDDDLGFSLPSDAPPSAIWAIDTHRDLHRRLTEAQGFDCVFAAQKQGAARFREAGINGCEWLPVACDPEVHRRLDVEKEYDVAFVGHVHPGPRQHLLEQVQRHFPRSFIGQVPHTEMCESPIASRTTGRRSCSPTAFT
jgi:hypothetical protein